jgi:hypothetical protein
MSSLQSGSLVRHASLGVGKVVALEPGAAHVFFPSSGGRFAAKLRLPAAAALLTTEGITADAWLAGLSSFTLDAESGRYALTATWLTPAEAIERYTATAKGPNPKLGGERAVRWRAAHDVWAKELGGGTAERLVSEADAPELARRAQKIAAALPPGVLEEGALAAAFSVPASTLVFFGALLELVALPVPGKARFEKLFAAAAVLPAPPTSRWAIATLFPFLARPDRHLVLVQKPTSDAAARLGRDLGCTPTPGWEPYAALRALATELLEPLKAVGGQDLVDVECFLYATATKRAPPKARRKS